MSPIFLVTMSAVFIGHGLIDLSLAFTFTIVMGASFLAHGIALFFMGRMAFK